MNSKITSCKKKKKKTCTVFSVRIIVGSGQHKQAEPQLSTDSELEEEGFSEKK